MKKMLIAALATGAICAAQAGDSTPLVGIGFESESPITIGAYGNYGINSGYQLYGSLLNSEPTMSGYQEIHADFRIDDLDLGQLAIGVWSNNDLTNKRRGLYGKAFNEYDPQIHWTRTFWFDDEKTWGLKYLTEFVWYIYPNNRGHHAGNPAGGRGHYQSSVHTMTTMDWNHYFELQNPYVTPYFKWVHEYHENKANLFLGGLKKKVALDELITEGLSLTPTLELVYRSHRYNWCFPTAGWSELHGSGMASLRLGTDINFGLTDHIGLFAKIYWCHTVDRSLRSAAEHGYGNDYGQYKDFAWGAIGLEFYF